MASMEGPHDVRVEPGRVIDHVAISVDNLDETLARLREAGIKLLSAPRKVNGTRSAFIQVPDNMELELVEGHASRPNTGN